MNLRRGLCLLLALFIFVSICFTGCEKIVKNSENTKIVVDMMGREVRIPEYPERIVCLYAATAHMMTLVGKTEKIIGAPGGIKRDILLRTKYPDIINVASPAEEGSINAEELVRLEPDLVLVRRSIVESLSESEKLDKLGIPYVVVDFYSIEDVQKSIRIIGEIFDKQEICDDYIAYMNEMLSMVEERIKGIDESEKIRVYHSTNNTLVTDTRGGICDEITHIAGVVNVAIEVETVFGFSTKDTTIEELYKWDPDAIIVNEYYAVQYIMMNKKWEGLAAVQNNNVISLPLGISRWCHQGSIEPHMGVLFIAWKFYPERFSDIDIKAIINDYYTRFFEIEMDEELIERILTGEGMRDPK